ncbi:hypothetical protein AB9P05_10035 [Roseivirga sp. BDSF3-8]|uniref:hypothetical protein n=1 Tax=Roseivirga sp. BDSF3-8 TaxID=3241598 RepID=UPI00353189DD
MKNLIKKMLLTFSVASFFLATGCNPPVYVTQSQQAYHDYTAVNHNKVVNKTKKPRTKNKRNKRY